MAVFVHDTDGKLIPPVIYLQKRNLDDIGILRYDNLSGEETSNDFNTISFDVYRYIDGELNPLYDSVVDMQLAYIPEHGHYSLSVSIDSDGVAEKKTVSGTSWESELGKLYLQDFQANTAEEGDLTDEDGDFIQTVFYSETEPSRSLLHRVLRDTNWEIHRAKNTQEYVDVSAKIRIYDVSWEDKYSFLKDLQDELDVVFVFDKHERKITWYTLDDFGSDTGIFITFNNLAENITIDSDDSKLVTELVVHGGDGIDVDQVIPAATNSIFNPSYFLSEQYMSKETIDAYNYYMEYYTQAKTDYVNYMKDADSWNIKLTEYQTAKPLSSVEGEGTQEGTLKGLDEMSEAELRSNFAWKDGAEYNYGYNHLKTIKATYEEVKAARDESGNTSDQKYTQIVLIIQLVGEYMAILEPLMENASSQMETAYENAAGIKTNCDLRIQFSKYFEDELGLTGVILDQQTEKSFQEINSFRITDEYTNENYIATENETYNYDEILDHTQELLDRAEAELNKYCVPYLTWSCDLQDLFRIPEFLPLVDGMEFNAGDFIYLELHDDFSVRVRVTNISFDYSENGSLSLDFADRIDDKTVIDDISEMIGQAGSVASSMQYYAKQMDKYDEAYKDIFAIINYGLDASKINIYNNDNQEVVTDTYGILCRKLLSSEIYSPEQIRIQSGQIVFTDDNWDTVSTALGKITLNTSNGLVETYGLIAKAVLAGYIQGSEIVGGIIQGSEIIGGKVQGSEIVGGKITSDNYKSGTQGSMINLKDGTFDFGGGTLTFDGSTLELSGKIHTTAGTIGGFDIGYNYLANGTYSLGGAASSVYVGTNGISCGTAFQVTNTGNLNIGNGGLTYDGSTLSVAGEIHAESGSIGGFDIYNDNLHVSWSSENETLSARLDKVDVSFERYTASYHEVVFMGHNGFYITYNDANVVGITASTFVLPGGNVTGDLVVTGSIYAPTAVNPSITLNKNGLIKCTSFDIAGWTLTQSGGQSFYLNPPETQYAIFLGVKGSSGSQNLAWTFCPKTDNSLCLGHSSYRWGQIYSTSSVISTSDRNEKNTIEPLDAVQSEKLIRGILPKSYKYNYGTSDRKHYGMIAQDVEDLLNVLNIDTKDFAGFIKYKRITTNELGETKEITDENENPMYGYGLRYEEFIAPIIQCIQRLFEKVEQLESKIE